MPKSSTEDLSVPPSANAARLRQIGFLPLLALFYGYTAGGPFGYEEIFHSSGPGMALVFLTFVPLFWSIPISFAAAELNSLLPVQGGFYRWSRAAFGDFWGFQCGWWNWTGTFLLNSLYGVLLMDYLSSYFPWIHGKRKVAGRVSCAVLPFLSQRARDSSGRLAFNRIARRRADSCDVALHRGALSLAPQSGGAVHAAGTAIWQRLRQRPCARDVELRRIRAAFEHDGRDERFAAHFRPPAGVEHADEHRHLRASDDSCARGARQLVRMEDGLHRHRFAH